jgi:thiosulfate dehydrogenase [quinone] large subunit
MFTNRKSVKTTEGYDLKNPSVIRFLFNDPRMAWLWLIIRVLAGIKWLQLAWEPKLMNASWMDGSIVKGFWEFSLAIPEGRADNQIIYGWYEDFIRFLLNNDLYKIEAPLQAVAETAIGVAFILGAFTGLFALLACFLHWNYIMIGSAGNNGLLFPAAVLLVAAWKIAGYYGLDYFLMRRVGALWTPRTIDHVEPEPTRQPAT